MEAMFRIISAIVLSGLLLSGCNQSPTGPALGGPSGTIGWSASAGTANPLPGIDQASVCYEGPAFVVWTAFGGGGSHSTTSGMQGVKGRGRLWSRENDSVEYQFETKDGKSGPVTINGAQYNLADGGLFLVAAKDGQIQVKQLKRDMSGVKFDRENLEAFARNDAEIMAFFVPKE